MLNTEVINEIKTKVNYLEFYSQFLEDFKKTGKSYWARCPFHQETKPSFQVNVNTGIWKCWGEQIGGDIFSFYSRYYNTTRNDAIVILAETYGVKIELSPEEQEQYDKNKRLYKINKVICQKYQENLFTPEGKIALNYITKRRLFSLDIIKKFKIGCGINNLPNDSRLLELNIIKEGENGIYSTFRSNRIVIPKFDESGKIVSFTGRLIDDESNLPKYLHTEDTPIYSKHENITGLYQAKYEIKKHKKVIIVEGELDMLRAHEKNICNTVALSGLALSEQQVVLLKKYTNNFYIYLEDDKTASALPRLYEQIKKEIPYANIYVITTQNNLNEKCDLDDYLKKHTTEDFKKCINRAKTYNEFQIQHLTDSFDVTQPIEVKTKFLYKIASFLNTIKNYLDRKQYIEMVAEKTMISEDSIYKAIKKCNKDEIRYQSESKITWLERPVYAQRIILSTFFADFNIYNLLDCIEKLDISSYMEPFYNKILNSLKDYILKNIIDGKVDYNNYFTDILTYNDKYLEDVITDIHMKSYELEDIEESQLKELLEEQIETLRNYDMSVSTSIDKKGAVA